MAFRTTSRSGGMDRYGDVADIPKVINALIEELETEECEEPDNEHAEVAVSHGNWTLSVHVTGLISLLDLSWIGEAGKLSRPIPPLRRWAKTRKGVADMLAMVARGEIDRVRGKKGWAPPGKLSARTGGDFFRQRKKL